MLERREKAQDMCSSLAEGVIAQSPKMKRTGCSWGSEALTLRPKDEKMFSFEDRTGLDGPGRALVVESTSTVS